ncbi:MAG: P-loop NTPase family protein [Armatimonadota bacterium]
MPANLTPAYRAAEARFRAGETMEDKLAALEEMYATILKHKGTEKLRADIKRRMAKLRGKEKQATAGKQTDVYHIVKRGARQIALIGPPNSGISALLARLTSGEGHLERGVISLLREADAVAIALDCSDDALLDHFEDIRAEILTKPAFVVANKIDVSGATENLDVLLDAYGDEFVIHPVSAETGEGIELLKELILELLGNGNGRELHA